jgi:hypothetical protein
MGALEPAEGRYRERSWSLEGLEGLEADWWLGTRTSPLCNNLFQIIF